MSSAFTIYKGAKIEIAAHASRDPDIAPGYFDLTVTETDGTEYEITVHFDTAEGFAAAKQLVLLYKAINATKEHA